MAFPLKGFVKKVNVYSVFKMWLSVPKLQVSWWNSEVHRTGQQLPLHHAFK